MILLDTCVLIDLKAYLLSPSELYVASMLSRAELAFGVVEAPTTALRQKRRTRLANLDEWLDWLPFDRAASDGYGTVGGASGLSGARSRSKDALIAGQAYALGAAVMTANLADFAPFEQYITVVAPTPRAAAQPRRRGAFAPAVTMKILLVFLSFLCYNILRKYFGGALRE